MVVEPILNSPCTVPHSLFTLHVTSLSSISLFTLHMTSHFSVVYQLGWLKPDLIGHNSKSQNEMVHNFRSNEPIHPIFERNLSFMIIHHPAKFHQNRSRTFWDNRATHTHRQKYTHTDRNTHTDTYTLMKIIPVQKQSFWAR